MEKAEEFIFPIKREQLFKQPNDDRFWLEEEYSYQNNRDDALKTFAELSSNPLSILSKPVFASFFYSFRETSIEFIEEKNHHAQKLLEAFYSFIITLDKNIDTIKQDKHSSSMLRNALKAYCFLINWIIEQFSYEQSTKAKTIKNSTKRHRNTSSSRPAKDKGKKQPRKRKNSLSDNATTAINSSQLIVNIPFMLKSLDKLIQIHLELIFTNKIIENELLSTIIITLFLLLKIKPEPGSPSPIHKEKDRIFLILNAIITQYQANTNIHIILQNLTTSIIELIYTNDTLTSNLAEFICLGANSNSKILSLATDIIHELIGIINKDSKYESQGMRNIATFFTALEAKVPKLIYSSMPVLIKLYDSKSYIIRNAISEMIGGVIIDCLSTSVDAIEDVEVRNEYYKAKQKFIEILFKRLYDDNCFCRNRVLQVFERLCDCNALGIEDYLVLMKEATVRVKDEKAQVRKRAIELLEKVIMIFATVFKCNGCFADVKQVDAEIEQSQARIEVIKAKIHKKSPTDDNNQPQEEAKPEENNANPICDDNEALFNDLNNEEAGIEYYSKYKTVISSINSTLPYIIDLLYSKSISDVIQSISLLKTLNQLNISEAFKGIKKMLNLILSSEPTVKKKLKETVISIYFNASSMTITAQVNKILHLMAHLSFSALNCLGLLIKEVIREHLISLAIIKEVYLRMIRTTDAVEDRNCLFFLVRASESDQRVILENAEVFLKSVEVRLRKEKIDWAWIREGLFGLTLIQKNMKEKEDAVEAVIAKIVRLMIMEEVKGDDVNGFHLNECDEWYGAAQEVINALFEIYSNPDVIANNLIEAMIKLIAEDGNPRIGTEKDVEMKVDGEMKVDDEMKVDKDEHKGNAIKSNRLIKISRLLFVIGHISLNMLSYIEKVQSQFKLTQQKKPTASTNDKNDHPEEDKENEAKRAYNIDLIQKLFETNYLSSPHFKLHCSLIASITKRLFTCTNLEIDSNPLLYKSALLALCKLMCINSQYCTDNLPFIFDILTSDSIPASLKLNLFVSLGDFINRFPNILHQYVPKLFSCLSSPNPLIRRYIITVISHLVLNDMLKLKGEIVDICLLIDTNDLRLRDNILFFFSKISHKGNNIIYNLLPKALAKLNDEYSSLPYEKVQSIIKLLVQYIEQDKQIENVLEKLFLKLKASVSSIEWRNVSYCLSLLNYSDRHAIKFLELYSAIREKINYDDVIEENFANVISKIKKGKNKEEVEELEKKMLLGKKIVNESRKGKRKRSEVKANGKEAKEAKANGKEKGGEKKAKAAKKKKSQKKYYDGSDDEDELYDSLEDELEENLEQSEEESVEDNDIDMDQS